MKGKITVVLSFVLIFVMLVSCGNNAFKADLTKYINEDLKEVTQPYNEISAETVNWQLMSENEHLLVSVRENIIPRLEKILKRLESMEISDKKIKALNDMYIKGIKKYQEGYALFAKALEKDDTDIYDSGSAIMEEGHKILTRYFEDLDKLAKEQGIRE